MTHFLQLNLVAPLQSWGATSKANNRTTEHHPTKSGIIGLIANAMGITREETETIQGTFKNTKIHVRVDAPGKLLRDYGTVAYNNKTKQVNRYYLQNAKFVVLVEDDEEVLRIFDKALKNPVNPIFLGRKSCVPTIPVYVPPSYPSIHLGETPGEVFEELFLLTRADDLTFKEKSHPELQVEIIEETLENTGDRRMDSPISFSSKSRLYSPRNVRSYRKQFKNPHYIEAKSKPAEISINPMGGV